MNNTEMDEHSEYTGHSSFIMIGGVWICEACKEMDDSLLREIEEYVE